MEQVRLRCTFEYYHNKLDYGCNEVYSFMRKSGKSHEYAQLQEVVLRERNGCNSQDKDIVLEPFKLKTCPCNFLHPQFNYLMTIYEQYEKGNLFDEGGLAGQPNQIMEYMNYISYLKDLYGTSKSSSS
jgi:hypothetical protein